jgi:DNA-directed RNA polymerase I, II, and III subunit RPABC2
MSDIEDEEYKSEVEEEEEDEHIDSDEEEDEKKPRLLISSKEDKSLAEKVDSDAENVPDSDEEDEEEEDENKVVDSDVEDEAEDDVESVNEEEQNVPVPKKSSSASIVKSSVIVEEDEDSDEDMDEDDHYLQKFDAEINKNYLVDFHPECTSHNYEEIAALSVVIRDKHNNIIDDLHKTIPYLTKYEKSRIIGQRAKQIEIGAKPLVKVDENIIDSHIIAELELKEKKIPFIIRRPIPGGACEYWNVADLEEIGF